VGVRSSPLVIDVALGRCDREALVVALRRDGVLLLLLLLLLLAPLLLLLLKRRGQGRCSGGQGAAAQTAELGGATSLRASVDAPG
jgi:hypothetical protein